MLPASTSMSSVVGAFITWVFYDNGCSIVGSSIARCFASVQCLRIWNLRVFKMSFDSTFVADLMTCFALSGGMEIATFATHIIVLSERGYVSVSRWSALYHC